MWNKARGSLGVDEKQELCELMESENYKIEMKKSENIYRILCLFWSRILDKP